MSAAEIHRHIGLKFEEVEKRFGAIVALRAVSLEIAPGEFVALLGPNGAGKTTLLKIAAFLMRPTSGRVVHTGLENSFPSVVKRHVGFVAHSSLLYDELTAAENLSFFARLYGMNGSGETIERTLDDVGLAERSQSVVRTFSRGMRQRLTIARALLHDPVLLLLDEPSSGLDRAGVAWLAQTLASLHRGGCTVVMTMHARNELSDMVTRALWLERGRVLRDSTPGGDPASILASVAREA